MVGGIKDGKGNFTEDGTEDGEWHHGTEDGMIDGITASRTQKKMASMTGWKIAFRPEIE